MIKHVKNVMKCLYSSQKTKKASKACFDFLEMEESKTFSQRGFIHFLNTFIVYIVQSCFLPVFPVFDLRQAQRLDAFISRNWAFLLVLYSFFLKQSPLESFLNPDEKESHGETGGILQNTENYQTNPPDSGQILIGDSKGEFSVLSHLLNPKLKSTLQST